MWDLPGPGLEPVSAALAGGFLTTAPPGKPCIFLFNKSFFLLSPAAQIKNLMSQLGTKQDSSKLQENL